MRLAFLGVGSMGGALARGVISADFCSPEDITAYDPETSLLDTLSQETGCKTAVSAAEAVRGCDVVMLCVKPAVVPDVLGEISDSMDTDKMLISIAAGVRISKMQKHLPTGLPIIRVMPNTPAMVGAGATAIAASEHVSPAQCKFALDLFGSVGIAVEVYEDLLDAVTGLSGSGPAYVYMLVEAMTDAGVSLGLTRDAALKLAAQTCLGSARMVLDSSDHPAALRSKVTSPGGTTAAGCIELERSGFRTAVIDAVRAAAKRSKELSGC